MKTELTWNVKRQRISWAKLQFENTVNLTTTQNRWTQRNGFNQPTACREMFCSCWLATPFIVFIKTINIYLKVELFKTFDSKAIAFRQPNHLNIEVYDLNKANETRRVEFSFKMLPFEEFPKLFWPPCMKRQGDFWMRRIRSRICKNLKLNRSELGGLVRH